MKNIFHVLIKSGLCVPLFLLIGTDHIWGQTAAGMIEGGALHAVAISTGGELYAWGDQADGRLGNGTTATGSVTTAARVLKSGTTFDNATDASGGFAHSLAVDGFGNAWAFGDNSYGELGNNSTVDSGTAVQVLESSTAGNYLTGISNVSAGAYFSLATGTNGTAWAWGSNDTGRTGIGSTSGDQKYASRVTLTSTSYLSNIVSVSAGYDFGLALDGTGGVWAWGANDKGQLGQGNTTDTSRAVRFMLNSTTPLTGITAIAATELASVAVMWSGTNNGTVWCCGDQANGELGDGSTANVNKEYPVEVQKVGGAPLTDVVQVAAGPLHVLALDGSGNVWAWGYNEYGNLGNGTTTTSSNAEEVSIPVNPGTSIVSIGAGGDDNDVDVYSFSYAVGSDGAIYSWGWDGNGELGNGATSSSTSKSPTNYSTLPDLSNTYVTYNSSGLSGLVLNGTSVYYNDGYGGLGNTFIQLKTGTVLSGIQSGHMVYNPSTLTTTGTWSWGSIAAQYSTDGQRVYIDVTVTNSLPLSGTESDAYDGYTEDENTIDEFSAQFMTLLVPGNDPGYQGASYTGTDPNLITTQTMSSQGDAPVVPGYYEQSGTISAGAIVVNDEMLPNTSGTAPDVELTLETYGTSSSTKVIVGANLAAYTGGADSDTQPPYFVNPIPPGSTVSFELAVGGESYGNDPSVVRSDIYSKFVSKFPVDSNGAPGWPNGGTIHDNRAIARVFLASGSAESYNNPRAWTSPITSGTYSPYFANGNPSVAEEQSFRSALLASASNTVAAIQTTGTITQAVIFWDTEGEHFPQPEGTYIGDPRLIMPDVGLTGTYAVSWTPDSSQTNGQPMQSSTQASVAPEMDYSITGNPNLRTIDEYFNIFTEAGYLIGMTLRPDLFLAGTPDSTGTSTDGCWQYDPNADNVLSSLPLAHQRVVQLLETKIWFAMDRWGMRVFYVDSNSPYDEAEFRQVVDDFYAKYGQRLLLIPEQGSASFYSSTAKYHDFGYVNTYPLSYFFEPGDVYDPAILSISTPSSILRSYIYPNAYSVVVAKESELPEGYSLTTYQAQLKSAVQQGDILLYNGWFTYENSDMQDVINAYAP
jgi:alpha-tubulin suppressor-like RCC1 family protein